VGVIVHAVNQGIRLVVIPLSIKMLGVEQYGLWLVVGSLVAWGGVADLGLAPGLVNVVATAQGRGDGQEMRRAISTAFAAYGVLAMVVAALAIALSRWSGLPGLLGARTPQLAESGRMLVLVCGLIFAASTLTRVVSTTTSALQKGYLGYFSYLAGSAVSLGLLFALAARGWGGLLSYVLIVSVPPLLAQVLLAGYVFGLLYRDLRPAWKWCDGASLRTLWGFAGPLTVYQLANLGVLYSANLLIANRLGAGTVPQYSVPYAAFAIFIATALLLVTPYTPALAEAKARGDWHWIEKRAVQLLLASVGMFMAGALVLTLAGQSFIKWWTHKTVHPTMGLLVALMIFGVFRVAGNTLNEVLTGLGLVRFTAGAFLAVSAFFVVASWLALPVFGLIAVPVVCGIAQIVYLTVSLPVAFRHMERGKAHVSN
jgi:O-antigen/teichoic acid export membrane protein